MCIMGAISISMLVYNQRMISRLRQERSELATLSFPAIQASMEFSKNVHKTGYLLSAYVESGDESFYRDWQQTWSIGLKDQLLYIQQMAEEIEIESARKTSRRIGISLNLLEDKQRPIMDAVRRDLKVKGFYREDVSFDNESFYGGNASSVYVASQDKGLLDIQQQLNARMAGEIVPYVANVAGEAEILNTYFAQDFQARLSFLDEKLATLIKVGYWIVGLGTLVAVVLGFWVIVFIFRHVDQISNTIRQFSKGNIPEPLGENRNETNLIIRKLNHLGTELGNVKNLAEHIGEGHFDESITAFEHSSDLGASLASMRSSLHEVAEEDRRRLWVNEGYAQVAHTLRSNNDNLQNLCDEVLHLIVKYLDCNQGALYLLEGDEGGEIMEVRSLYAYNKKKFDDIKVAYGEGLVGQVWRDEDELYITDVPNDYVRIRSGLGGAEPNCLYLVPMVASQKIVGILELASFHAITHHEKEFIQRASEAIATAVGNVKMNERNLLLLKSSQEQAEELRAQEEEMRQNMEELQSTQEEMFRAQRELQAKERNLDGVINNTTDTIFAIDKDYCITVVNKFLRDKYAQMGINLQLGTSILNLLKGEARAAWKARYDRALSGERFHMIEERTTDEGSKAFAQTFHNPIKDSTGKVVGVSVISRDVTDLMKAEAEAKSKEVTLNALINSTDDTYFAIDRDFKILVANKTLRDRFRAGGVSLEEGDSIFDKLPEDQHDKWRDRYERIFSGERFIIEEERRVKNTVLYIQGHYIPIFNDDEEVVGGIVMSKDITDVRQAMAEKELRDQEIEKLRKQIGLEAAEAMVGNGHSGNGNGNGKKSPRSKLEAKLQQDPKK
ncbi:MAG TPA: hypothetical protein DCE41_09000 [Cytophagales bacterium]|nr:hypothetical protein [Cytophagales bacterium]HAA21326.1 hypothetical protein [Cytophagales bacterium]HAP58374.1 hypothetical protein [Cytophagales bacterium]